MADIEYRDGALCLDKLDIDGNIVENIQDPEGRTEIKTDSESKILSYRDSEGVMHENVGINTSKLILTEDGMTEFQKALKDSGFNSGAGNWSDAKELHISEPYCARINFTGIDNIPQTRDANLKDYMEFWDMQGNYFKKEVIMNAQGRSSMGQPKKNISIDICNNNGWDDEDTFNLQIGNWVIQDSFHLKAYYTDPFRCVGPIAYKLWEEIGKSRGILKDYVWKRALIDSSDITETSTGVSEDEMPTQVTTGAKCVPAGFPCIVYLNGEFYGIYSWQLKKQRDNYHLSKNSDKNIHLDGVIYFGTIFNANGDSSKMAWRDTSKEGFEIRNPKNLVYSGKNTFGNSIEYKIGDKVVYELHLYESLVASNVGHLPTDTSYWKDLGKLGYKYDADTLEGEIAGNDDGSMVYDDWSAGSYQIGKIVKHSVTYDGKIKSFCFINTVASNTKEPAVTYDSKKEEWLNIDKNPDFKNKTKCGWINCSISVNVKHYILELSKVMNRLSTAFEIYNASEKTQADKDAFKAVFETYFDITNVVDYLIFIDVLKNQDGIAQNVQWVTYDGIKWYLCTYDCDVVMGSWWEATQYIPAPLTNHINIEMGRELIFNYLEIFYNQELEERYAELRKLNIIDATHITNMVADWHSRLGNRETFEKEWNKWSTFVKNDSIMRLNKWITTSISNMDAVYNYN